MSIKSKITRAFAPKQRTKKEVDDEYAQTAIWHGHKSRMLAQVHQDADRLQKEIDAHLAKLLELNQEGMKLQIPPQKPPILTAPKESEIQQKEGA